MNDDHDHDVNDDHNNDDGDDDVNDDEKSDDHLYSFLSHLSLRYFPNSSSCNNKNYDACHEHDGDDHD